MLLSPDTLQAVHDQCTLAAEILSRQPGGEFFLEFGADLVIDSQGTPHMIEVNSRPRGRLALLATQDPGAVAKAHVDACARPLRFLAARVR